MDAYATEAFLGLLIVLVGAGVKSWTASVTDKFDDVLRAIETINREFHEHRLVTERRVTKVEGHLEALQWRFLTRPDIQELLAKQHGPEEGEK